MSLLDINIYGVYFSPISAMMIIAAVITVVLSWLAGRTGFLTRVWHPALFGGSIYVIVLSLIVYSSTV